MSPSPAALKLPSRKSPSDVTQHSVTSPDPWQLLPFSGCVHAVSCRLASSQLN